MCVGRERIRILIAFAHDANGRFHRQPGWIGHIQLQFALIRLPKRRQSAAQEEEKQFLHEAVYPGKI